MASFEFPTFQWLTKNIQIALLSKHLTITAALSQWMDRSDLRTFGIKATTPHSHRVPLYRSKCL